MSLELLEAPQAEPAIHPAIELARRLAHNPFDPILSQNPLGISNFLIENAIPYGTTGRSLLHAHVEGLHSIMLYDRHQTAYPGEDVNDAGKIRLFFTEPGKHPLNHFIDPRRDYNCRPHDHQFGATIVPLIGSLMHVKTSETDVHTKWKLNKFLFETAVGHDDFITTPVGEQHLEDPLLQKLVPTDLIQLTSTDIHSVTSYEYRRPGLTAWLVIEAAKEDKDSLLFSTAKVPSMDASKLYKPATNADVERILTTTLERLGAGSEQLIFPR
jgi:hypothetical protein